MGVFQTEGNHAGEFIVSEVDIDMSRETVVVALGSTVVAGTVMAQVTIGGKYVPLAPAASDGSEVAAGVLFDEIDTTADADGIILNNLAVVNNLELDWGAADAGEQAIAVAELKALNVFVK